MTIPDTHAVIFVDDDYALTATLTLVIRRFFPEHPVYTCQTSAQALGYMTQMPIACVITDYYLGRDDGDILAQTISTQWPELPIILLTGLDLTSNVLNAGHYAAVLTKPISIYTLRTVLQEYLRSEIQA